MNLYRSSDEAVLGGVLAGLAHSFDLNLSQLRLIMTLVLLFTSGTIITIYIILWAILKPRPTRGQEPYAN